MTGFARATLAVPRPSRRAAFVGAFPRPADIRIFSPVLGNVKVNSQVMAILMQRDLAPMFAKCLVVDDRIVTVIDLFGRPFDEQHVAAACHMVGDTSDANNETLQKHLGSQTHFSRYGPPKLPGRHASYL